jgi:hypothetical protein
MAEKIIEVGVKTNIPEVTENVASLKTQLRQAQNEVNELANKFGATSKEAIEAAKRAAELKDAIGDAKALTDAFNPDAKFKALTATLGGVAGGFSAVQGAIGLMGAESENVEKALLKVQSAMALSQGVQAVGESVDSVKQLGAVIKTTSVFQGVYNLVKAAGTQITNANTVANEANTVSENQSYLAKAKNVIVTTAQSVATGVVTAAQWLWNTAIMANPVVAVAVGVAALTAGIYALTKSLIDSSDEADKAAAANVKLDKNIDSLAKTSKKSSEQLETNNNQTIALAKASGKSAEEIRKLTLELANQEVTEKRVNAVKAYSIYLEAKRVAGLEDSTDAQKATAQKALEAYKTINQDYEKSIDKRNGVIRANKVSEIQEETDKQKKLSEAAEKAQEERNKKAQELRDEAKKKRIKDAEDEAKRLADIEKKKLAADMDSANKALEIVNELKANNETPAQKEQREYEEKKAILVANNLSTEELDRQHKAVLVQNDLAYWSKQAEDAKTVSDKKANDEKVIADNKIQTEQNVRDAVASIASNGVEIVGAIEDLGLKKSKATEGIKKGIALAEIASNTAMAISNAVPMAINAGKEAAKVAGPAAPVVGPLVTAASFVGSAAMIAKNIANAKKILSGGGSISDSAGAAGATSTPTAGATSTPTSTPVVDLQQRNDNNNLSGAQAVTMAPQEIVVKAIVSETEISKSQQTVANIKNKSEL